MGDVTETTLKMTGTVKKTIDLPKKFVKVQSKTGMWLVFVSLPVVSKRSSHL